MWMLKSHQVTLHHVITVHNDMVNHMDGVMQALAKKMTQWNEDSYFAVKFAHQKLSQYYAEVTPTLGMLLISALILDLFQKLGSFRKSDKGMDIYPEHKTTYTSQYQETFLKYVKNEYWAKNQRLPDIEPESVRAQIISPPQWLQNLIDLLMIHLICQAVPQNT